jgi:hypothetical protein
MQAVKLGEQLCGSFLREAVQIFATRRTEGVQFVEPSSQINAGAFARASSKISLIFLALQPIQPTFGPRWKAI